MGASAGEAVQQAAPSESFPTSHEVEEDVKVLPYLVDDAEGEDIVALVGE